MTDYPTRDELDAERTWDLTRIFETPEDWEAAREELETAIADLHDLEAPTRSPERLAEVLDAIESALARKSTLTLYAQLGRNEDTTDEDRRDRHRRSQDLAAEVDEAVRAARRAIHRDADRVREYRDDPALDGYEAYVDDLLAQAPHTREAGAESVIATFEPVVESGTDPVVAITTGDFDPPTVEGPGGEAFDVDRNTLREALDDPDREFRKRAYEAFYDALGDHEHALAATVAQKVRAYAALAEARNYDSVREMKLSRDSYPKTGMHVDFLGSAHDALVENVRDHLDAYHDLLASRRESLGVETLRPWDTSAPIADGDPPDFTYDEVREHVLAAVEPLGEDYRDRLETFLDERRVDVYPTQNKRTDIPAYCPSSPETGAFVLANFREDLRTAFFLAHELGHAMHVEEMRAAQPPRYVTSPQPISEVPSIVHELLLAEHLLDAGDPDLAPFVRERRAEFLSGNVYGAAKSAAFCHDLYRIVEDGGDLNADRVADRYEAYATEFDEPIDAPNPGVQWRREAFARQPYHSYQYVLGAVGAVSVFQRIRSGDLTTDAYRDFLRNTGRRDSVESFQALGVDVTDSAPYERVGDELDRIAASRPTRP